MLPGFASKKKRAKQLQTEAAMRTFRQTEQQTQPRRLVPFSPNTTAGTPFDFSFQRKAPDYAQEEINRNNLLKTQAQYSFDIPNFVPPNFDPNDAEQKLHHFVLRYAGLRVRQDMEKRGRSLTTVEQDAIFDESIQNAIAHGFPEKFTRQQAESKRGFWKKAGIALLQGYATEFEFLAKNVVEPIVHSSEEDYYNLVGLGYKATGQRRPLTGPGSQKPDLSAGLQRVLTEADKGKIISRPVMENLQEALAFAVETSSRGRETAVSRAIRNETVTEIGAEILNPAYLIPGILSLGTIPAGTKGAMLWARVLSELVGTGMEPTVAVGFLRGLRAGIKMPGRGTLRLLSKGTVASLNDEADARRMAGYLDEKDPGGGGSVIQRISRWVMSEDDPYKVGLQLSRARMLALAQEGEIGGGRLGRVAEDLQERQRVLTDIIQEKTISPISGRPVQEPPLKKSPLRRQIEDEIKAGKTAEELLDETVARIHEKPRLAGEEVGEVSPHPRQAEIDALQTKIGATEVKLSEATTEAEITKHQARINKLEAQQNKIEGIEVSGPSFPVTPVRKTGKAAIHDAATGAGLDEETAKIISEADLYPRGTEVTVTGGASAFVVKK